MSISLFWLWLAAGLYLLFEMWRGWRRGVARHGVSVLALLTAGGVGWVFAWMTGFITDRIIPLPPPAGRVMVGVAVGLAFYLAAVVLSSLLLKKTSQQNAGMVRLVYGVGGAFFGLVFGLLILWGGVSIFRMFEAVAEAKREMAAPGGGAAARVSSGREAGGGLLERIDILPTEFYGTLTKLMQVSGSPRAAERLLTYPPLQKLLAQPKLAAIFSDPEVARAAADGNYPALLTSPKIAAVASDPEVQKSFTAFDWQKALDYALQEKPTSPAP